MTRKPIIAGNWKMNKDISKGVVLAQEISNNCEDFWFDKVDVVVCPPYLNLKPVKTVFDFDKMKIGVGAQNVYWEESGAYTGEVSVPMLKAAGCQWCIIGHSERRQYFSETNEFVNRKAKALIKGGITPIICVGESLEVRDAGDALHFVCEQVKAALAGIDTTYVKDLVIAYEPIWAIGTGRTATPEQAQEVCQAIRATIADIYGKECSDSIRILYGGSMNPGNVDILIAEPDIDGGLIGGAALEASSFVQLIKACL